MGNRGYDQIMQADLVITLMWAMWDVGTEQEQERIKGARCARKVLPAIHRLLNSCSRRAQSKGSWELRLVE